MKKTRFYLQACIDGEWERISRDLSTIGLARELRFRCLATHPDPSSYRIIKQTIIEEVMPILDDEG